MKIDALDIINIKKLASRSIRIRSGVRLGQAIFNAAYEYFPIAVNKLRGTEYDCFYDDDRIGKFLEKLREFDAE